jgi:pimeloyl-ACP methyl ester carboxylesterase
MLAACHPVLVRALIVGDAPLSPAYHRTGEDPAHRQMNVLWHALAASDTSVDEIAASLRAMPIRAADGTIREAAAIFGADNPWFPFQAENLHQLDPEMLAAVLDSSLKMLGGYDPGVLLPRVTCPVLLLQAERDAALSDADVALAWSLIANVTHVRLAGADHSLGTERVLAATGGFLHRIAQREKVGRAGG